MKVKPFLLMAVVVIVSFVLLIHYFGLAGLIAGILETILLFVLANPLETIGILASVAKALRGADFWFEKNAVEKRLESTIGLSSSKVNEENKCLPHGVDIKWVEPSERDAFLREGKIVVCLEPSQNEDRNLSRATMLYVAEDLIRESQRFVDPTVMNSLNFSIARKMLMLDKRLGALKCLNEEYIEPEAEKNPIIREYVLAMQKMNEEGTLTRILLQEFSELDSKLSPALSDIRAFKETKGFTNFLKTFSEKGTAEDVPLQFQEEIIRVNIMPIARLEAYSGTDKFVTKASECHQKGIDKIYVLAKGVNSPLAKLIVKDIEASNLYSKEKESKFKITSKGGIRDRYIALLVRKV